jgi:biopolymer transport protein ExbD
VVPLSKIDVSALASVITGLLFLMMRATPLVPDDHRSTFEAIGSEHADAVPGALREDALVVVVTCKGLIYFGHNEVAVEELSTKIRKGLQEGAERRVYMRVDARARYFDAARVLNEIQLAGVGKVSFITRQRER